MVCLTDLRLCAWSRFYLIVSPLITSGACLWVFHVNFHTTLFSYKSVENMYHETQHSMYNGFGILETIHSNIVYRYYSKCKKKETLLPICLHNFLLIEISVKLCHFHPFGTGFVCTEYLIMPYWVLTVSLHTPSVYFLTTHLALFFSLSLLQILHTFFYIFFLLWYHSFLVLSYFLVVSKLCFYLKYFFWNSLFNVSLIPLPEQLFLYSLSVEL